MNRRTLLGGVASLPFLALPGCQAIGFTTPVMVTIENETDEDRNVLVTAYDVENDRQTYDEAVNAPSDHTASLGHLSNTDQVVRVVLFERAGGTEADEDAEALENDPEGGDESGADDGSDGDDESGAGDEPDESDDGVEAVEETFIGTSTQSITIYVTSDGLDLAIQSRE